MPPPAHIIVFGNEKGGSGKSTTAMQVAVGLLKLGYTVATIDLDARQGTLTRYMSNRFDTIAKTRRPLPSPVHMPIEKSKAYTLKDQEKEDRNFLLMALEELRPTFDFILIDTPGSDIYLSRLAHSYADLLVTPMNDSFIDLDVLARIEAGTGEIVGPSIYTRMVLEQRALRHGRDGGTIDWIVMRNRLAAVPGKDHAAITPLLEKLGGIYAFRLGPGFGERALFREMFPLGQTLFDLDDESLSFDTITARQEVRHLLQAINPQSLRGYRNRVSG